MNPSLWDLLIAFPMLVALVVLFAAVAWAEFRDRRRP